MFSSITFWCEFPEKVDWKSLELHFPAEIYITASSRKEFMSWREKIPKKFKLGVWPVISREEGYWFSGFCSRESISKLLEFQGLDVKIDIEPPLPRFKFSSLKILLYGLKMLLFKKAKNNRFLRDTVEVLSKNSRLIISGLPLPRFLLRRYGDRMRWGVGRRNFFIYTTLFSFLRPYYAWFIKSRLKIYNERAMFAIGCVGPGIFGDEPVYKNIDGFEKDLKWFADLGVKNLVVFNLHGISTREDAKDWFEVLVKYKA